MTEFLFITYAIFGVLCYIASKLYDINIKIGDINNSVKKEEEDYPI